jgi:hypothetical protein
VVAVEEVVVVVVVVVEVEVVVAEVEEEVVEEEVEEEVEVVGKFQSANMVGVHNVGIRRHINNLRMVVVQVHRKHLDRHQ